MIAPRQAFFVMQATCVHCGQVIHRRNDLQGWLHATEDARCVLFATPAEGKLR